MTKRKPDPRAGGPGEAGGVQARKTSLKLPLAPLAPPPLVTRQFPERLKGCAKKGNRRPSSIISRDHDRDQPRPITLPRLKFMEKDPDLIGRPRR
jgi:hypothetical protein